MRRKITNIFCMVLLCIVFLSVYETAGSASGGNGKEFPVEVYPHLPQNQQGMEKKYFDLLMESGQKQTLQIELNNVTEVQISLEVFITEAMTSSEGRVDYGNMQNKTISDQYSIRQIVSAEKNVIIPAGEKRILDLEIVMPEEEFEGILAGGMVLRTSGEETGVGSAEYVTAILLRSEKNTVKADLTVQNICFTVNEEEFTFTADIVNGSAAYADHVYIDLYVYGRNKKKLLYEEHKQNIEISPFSTFQLFTQLDEELAGGRQCSVRLEFSSEDGRWVYEEEFAGEEKGTASVGLFLAAAVLLGLGGGVSWSVYRIVSRRKREEALKEQLLKAVIIQLI